MEITTPPAIFTIICSGNCGLCIPECRTDIALEFPIIWKQTERSEPNHDEYEYRRFRSDEGGEQQPQCAEADRAAGAARSAITVQAWTAPCTLYNACPLPFPNGAAEPNVAAKRWDTNAVDAAVQKDMAQISNYQDKFYKQRCGSLRQGFRLTGSRPRYSHRPLLRYTITTQAWQTNLIGTDADQKFCRSRAKGLAKQRRRIRRRRWSHCSRKQRSVKEEPATRCMRRLEGARRRFRSAESEEDEGIMVLSKKDAYRILVSPQTISFFPLSISPNPFP